MAGPPRRCLPGAGRPGAPIQGSLQLIFCDIGTPGDDWNVYDELRDQLDTSALAARLLDRSPPAMRERLTLHT